MRQMCTRAAVPLPTTERMSSNKVCSAIVSAAAGTPAKPMRVAKGPLAATPLPSQASKGCSQTV